MSEFFLITRIVKMSFHPDKIEAFLEVFNASKEKIRGFDGCHSLELLQNKTHGNIFFTLSKWDNEAALERYRTSALFRTTWAKTKILFNVISLWLFHVIAFSNY